MPYSTANPPRLINQDIGNQSPAHWNLTGTDAVTVVRVNGYITNARALGMKVGDVVRYANSSTSPISIQNMIVVAIGTNGSADLSDGTAVSNTNTD